MRLGWCQSYFCIPIPIHSQCFLWYGLKDLTSKKLQVICVTLASLFVSPQIKPSIMPLTYYRELVDRGNTSASVVILADCQDSIWYPWWERPRPSFTLGVEAMCRVGVPKRPLSLGYRGSLVLHLGQLTAESQRPGLQIDSIFWFCKSRGAD